MSGENSMEELASDSYAFALKLKEEVRPNLYMVQSWFRHPTAEEIKDGEDVEGSFLNLAKKIILMAKETHPGHE
jgi:hypothetical protein